MFGARKFWIGCILILNVVLCQDLKDFCDSCIDSFRKTGPLQVTIPAVIGQNVSLPCNSECGSKGAANGDLGWYRKNLNNEEVEVKLDVHSDDTMNRVFVDSDNNLVINGFEENDVDVYFCQSSSDHFGGENPEPGIYYYLEYLSSSDEIKPSVEGDMYQYLYYQEELQHVNLHIIQSFKNHEARQWTVFSSWGPWSSCSDCGRRGIRRREGQCRVRRNPDRKYIFFESRLTSFERSLKSAKKELNFGLSCSSRSLDELPELNEVVKKIPSFTLMEYCHVKCVEELPLLRHRMKYEKPKLYKQKKSVMYHNDIYLECPGAKLNSFIKWSNKTDLIKNSKRTYINSHGTLIVKKVNEWDAGTYTCWINGVPKIEIHIHIIQKPTVKGLYSNLILALGFLISFTVFLIIVLISDKM